MGEKLIALIFGNDKSTQYRRFYLKSLLLLVGIVILVTDHFFKISDSLRILIGETNIFNIVTALEIISYCLITLFLIAAAIAIVFLILSMVFYVINEVKLNKEITELEITSRYIYYGSVNRAKDSFDWLLVGAILLYTLDRNYMILWQDNVSPLVIGIFIIILFYRLATSLLIGIVNRFFRLKDNEI